MERWFTKPFRDREPATIQRIQHMVETTNLEGYVACSQALQAVDLREQIARIATPTLVISATHDPAAPPSDGQFVAQHIPHARYLELDAAHLSNIEQQQIFTKEVSDFLRTHDQAKPHRQSL
jgi:3-oxoadipate enol-lactonase